MLLLHDPPRRSSVAELIAATPLGDENIVTRHIASSEQNSLFLVRIGGRELPHEHAEYSLVVTLVGGRGELWLEGERLAMTTGDTAFVPRGAAHYFVNTGDAPATALVTFSPPFTGADAQPVEP